MGGIYLFTPHTVNAKTNKLNHFKWCMSSKSAIISISHIEINVRQKRILVVNSNGPVSRTVAF